MSERSHRARSAFSMVEMVVVIAILAMLTSMATLTLGGAMSRYEISRAADTIQICDAKARRAARLSRQPIESSFDRGEQELTLDLPNRSGSLDEQRFRLPRTVEIGDFRLRRKGVVGNRVDIPYSPQGASPTYAIELRRGKMSRWLVVLGLSGQVISVDTEGEVDALLSI